MTAQETKTHEILDFGIFKIKSSKKKRNNKKFRQLCHNIHKDIKNDNIPEHTTYQSVNSNELRQNEGFHDNHQYQYNYNNKPNLNNGMSEQEAIEAATKASLGL